MRKTFSIGTVVFLGLFASTFMQPAAADQLVMPAANETPHPVILPQRGERQAAVLREFGEPRQRHAPVGGSSVKRPPITRWDYDGYSVFFERTTVVDVVIKGDPPPISHVDELHPAP